MPPIEKPVESLAQLKALSAAAEAPKAAEPEKPAEKPVEKTPAEKPVAAKPAEKEAAPAAKVEETEEEKPEDAGSEEADGDAKPPVAAAPSWAPNYKLKVMDEEKEIPEAFRALIKDEASEKEVREIFEKAYGLDHAKPKHETVKKELGEVKQAHQQVSTRMAQWEGNLKRLETAAHAAPESPDFEQFLSFWKIPDDTLYKYVQRKLEYQEELAALSPAQRAQVEQAQRTEAQTRQVLTQNQQLQQAYAQQALQTRLGQVDQLVYSRPDIAEVAQQYCAGKKDPSAFKTLVQTVAKQVYFTTGKDISVEDAIRETMSQLGYEESDAAPATSPQAPAAAPAPLTTAAQRKLPVIPTVGSGSGAAPVKKVAGSIAELREMRDAMLTGKQ